MQRVIKFRAWTELVDEDGNGHMRMLDHDCLLPWLLEDLTDAENGKNILMQFTGLKDKNGDEIYEGDCFGDWLGESHAGYCDKCKSILISNHSNIGCMACLGDIHWREVIEDDGKLEVIGNIYENPQLLN